jgi:FkbM family methyltransferase
MIIKHFDVTTPETEPPAGEGWERTWTGYHVMSKCIAQDRKTQFEDQYLETRKNGQTPQPAFGRDLLLSLLTDIDKKHVNMFELGAGWGRLCLELAGIIDHNIIEVVPDSYRCLAVEGEPTHYEWTKDNFELQNINGIVVMGAVSDKNGSCLFDASPDPEACYGQAMASLLTKRRLPSLTSLFGVFKKRNIRVPMYTIDSLIQTFDFDRVDIIHIDVQGAEYKTMLGAKESLKKELIDYIWISTHHPDLNDKIRKLLSLRFDLILDIYPRSITDVSGFLPVKVHDGIQLYKRKNI